MSRTTVAAGFLLDTNLIGVPEATRRVVEHWQDGAMLAATPEGKWLLALPNPVTVRLDRAPGLALTRSAIAEFSLSDVEFQDLPVYPLEPVEIQPPAEILSTPPPVETPDLRSTAGIGSRPRRRFRSVAALDALWRNGFIAAAAAAVGVLLIAGPRALASIGCLAGIVGLLAGLFGAVRRSKTGSGVAVRARPPGRWRGRLAASVFASPFGHLLARRQLAYLKGIERAFSRREWDRALREAIPLGGTGGVLSMSLPKAWQGRLSPSATQRGGGRALGVGGIDTVFTDIYRAAATELEQAGQIEKAAYVLADLLDSPAEAVHLLERHRRYRLAAALAEGRLLEPALVVRLWWRAGDRRRAVDVARLRSAFAAALDRISDGEADRQLALELRTAWVESRREAGDHLGALAAAWPDPRLREAGVGDLQRAMALGGPAAAEALVYLLNLRGDDHARDTARALVSSRDPALGPARDRFLAAFGSLAPADPVHDRQIATAAAIAMTRDGFSRTRRKEYDALGRRADSVTIADLPKPRAVPKNVVLEHVCAPTAPGDLPVHDAAWVGGRLLLAHGGHGVRLVRTDGREVARWNVPAHGLAVSDSGTRVMLIAVGERAQDFHELDLATRRVRRWATLRVRLVASSYDGGVLTVVDEDGIAFVATNEADNDGKPRVIWRELDRRQPVVMLERAPAGVTALIRAAGPDGYELWSWHAPAALLRQRPRVELTGMADAAVLASGHLVVCDEREVLALHNGRWRRHVAPATSATELMSSGDTYALTEPGGEGTRVTLCRDLDPQPLARLDMPQPPAGMRATPGRVVLWTGDGRVVSLDLERGRVDADLRTAV